MYKRLLRNHIFHNFNSKTADRKLMTKQLPKELAHARELIDQADGLLFKL